MPVKERYGKLVKVYLKLAHMHGLIVDKTATGWEITLPESKAKVGCETHGALCTYIKAYVEAMKDNGEES